MRDISLVSRVAWLFAFGSAAVITQGCGSTPGSVGGTASGNGGRATINLGLGGQRSGFGGQYLGLGGQDGTRARGSGGMIADAARADVPADRKDARLEGTASDALKASSTRLDGAQGADHAAMPADARLAADHAVTPDLLAKEAGVRVTPPAMDVGVHLDLDIGAPDGPAPAVDVQAAGGLDAAAATECNYGGAIHAVGDAFPSDCNTCFCLASGEVLCTVKVCAVDGGAHRVGAASGKENANRAGGGT